MSSDYCIMINGLPGKMASLICNAVFERQMESSGQIELVYEALTGPDMGTTFDCDSKPIWLRAPEKHASCLKEVKAEHPNLIAIDFVKGKGQGDKNAQMYFENRIPFIMGSTGIEDYNVLDLAAKHTNTPCVAFPNMDKRIVIWMEMFKYAAENFSGSFADMSELSLLESHQAAKEDTSGTMKQMIGHLSALTGKKLTIDDITKIRDKKAQRKLLEVPEKWLGQHAYHFFAFNDPYGQDSERLEFRRHGGKTYVEGTMTALDFLIDVIENKKEARRYEMIDVLRKSA